MGLEVARETLGGKGPLAVLGLAVGATWQEIKSAYRRRALETHPDRGGTNAAFTEVQAAYEVLEAEYGMK
jgi:curved DNA-binding protein CbpA